MQNLPTMHCDEITNQSEIFVPAGKGRTSFVNARNAACAAFESMSGVPHLNKSDELTGSEALSYYEVAGSLSEVLKKPIAYRKSPLLSFIRRNWRKHKNLSSVLVMAII